MLFVFLFKNDVCQGWPVENALFTLMLTITKNGNYYICCFYVASIVMRCCTKNHNAQQDVLIGLVIFLGKGLFTMHVKQFYK